MPTQPLPEKLHYLHLVRDMRGGQIMIGCVEPFTDVAIALCSKELFASIKWKEGEELDQLLLRLDEAVGEAITTGKPVNELDAQFSIVRSKTRKMRR